MKNFDGTKRRSSAVVGTVVVAFFGLVLGCSQPAPPSPLAITLLEKPNREVPQYEKFELQFLLNRVFDNPYDPQEIDVRIRLLAPDGSEVSHPGFYDECYRLVVDYGKEVPRKGVQPRWRLRVTPDKLGSYSWRLTARAGGETAEQTGSFECRPSDRKGFVRIAEQDPRFFEFSDGSFYYPIGHNCRSLVDWRWAAFSPGGDQLAQQYVNKGVACYDDWFGRMADNGENFSAVWMAAWWCGLEWSRELPGYDGIGRYNQINAAKLDHVVEAAEKHDVRLLLYTQNHGALSSCVDGEWHHNPFNQRYKGGYLEFPSEYFSHPAALQAHRNRIRYTIARWGYSPAIIAWMLCTETDWVEPYHNQRSLVCDQREPFKGWPPESFEIPDQRDLVRKWLVDMARFCNETDAQPHLVSCQFSAKDEGREMWRYDEMQIVMHSCYTYEAADTEWLGEHFVGSRGVADILFVYGKRFETFDNRPVLLAEWGGKTDVNQTSQLLVELHTGIWTLFMTNAAGSTGFWWWNLIDQADLYPHYRALARFAAGEDRRGRRFRSSRARVLSSFPPHPLSGRRQPVDVESVREQAFVLSDDTKLFAYIFNRELNQEDASRPADRFSDRSFGATGACYLEIPDDLRPGDYVIEYWDTFRGEPFERREISLNRDTTAIPVVSHYADIALKMKLIAPH